MKNRNTRRGFTQRCFTKGFTLIELLVVVLIIGILAAVAVPQYQKAVIKSRATAALVYLKAMQDAEEVYFLANGEYTSNTDALDIEVTCPTGWTCPNWGSYAEALWQEGDNTVFGLAFYFPHYSNEDLRGKKLCQVPDIAATKEKGKSICGSMGKQAGTDSLGRTLYLLNS